MSTYPFEQMNIWKKTAQKQEKTSWSTIYNLKRSTTKNKAVKDNSISLSQKPTLSLLIPPYTQEVDSKVPVVGLLEF